MKSLILHAPAFLLFSDKSDDLFNSLFNEPLETTPRDIFIEIYHAPRYKYLRYHQNIMHQIELDILKTKP